MEFPRQARTSSSNTHFCTQLANNILLKTAAENGSNAVVSPFSFHLILSLIAVGSKGRTLEQLFQCLGSKSLEEVNSLASQMIDLASPTDEKNGSSAAAGDPDLSFVNAAWVAENLKLKPSFHEIVEGLYHAVAKEVDFANKAEEVVAEVNAWAETSTRGLIKNLLTTEALKSLNERTALILANALYFKGTWARFFDSSRTKTRAFHLSNGHTVHVPFMTNLGFERYHYRSFDGFKILKLPYKSTRPTRKFAMYFFLPDARDGLKSLLEMFKANPEYFDGRFDLVEGKVSDFWIPRFRFEFEFEASEAMIEMGLDLPFDRMKAELTEMVLYANGLLFVKKVFHKCFIEVNEEGTEAAACTAVIIEQQSQSCPIASFVADHPFMFMIKEEISGVVFFVGSVLNPLLN
ncbi:60S ribosomal protein L7a [Hibiscus syriacus]|uniref:60S ribosomal protein L7a n=1 Tax=Hibiscus syriacus TaxID=106335 RepID=A0A6A2Y8B5_HIBSY|nr:serpin-ZXA-like [Hibiscus syriacus]KAE8666004.1 60S ribosomal protein L7a [Hibiscus syriacus]